MTIDTTASTTAYTCDGVTTAFPVPFIFFDDDEIEVIERVTSTGVETVKTLASAYTVTGGDGSTGTVTAVSAPASGRTWTIRRVTGQTQETSLTAFGPLPSDVIELALDRVTAIMQEVVRDTARGLLVPKTEAGLILPSSVSRANKYLSFDASGNPVASATVDPGSVTISAFAETLLALANNAAFLAALNTGRVLYCGTAGGTADVQTLSPTTPITAYATGDVFIWLSPASVNTTNVTVNASGLGAKAFTRSDASALASGDLPASCLNAALYDGTRLRSLIPIGLVLDSTARWALASGNPRLTLDTNDYLEYDRTNNRHAAYVGGTLAPWRVGRGAASDDSVRMDQGWHRLAVTANASVVANLTFVLTSYIAAGFTRFRLEWKDLLPASDAALYARFSVDAGSTYKSGASDYINAYFGHTNSATGAGGGTAAVVHLSSNTAVESTGVGINGFLEWTTRAAAGNLADFGSRFMSSAAAPTRVSGMATFGFASIDAVLLGFVSVNLAAQGTVILYGSVD